MIQILLSPLLNMNAFDTLLLQSVISLAIVTPIWIMAAKEDYYYHSISNLLCMVLAVTIFLYAILFNSILSSLLDILLYYFVFRRKEIEYFGQADFLIVAHFLTCFCTILTTEIYIIIFGCIWLCSIILYIVFIRVKDKVVWKPFSGMMVPAIPSYTLAIIISSITYYPLIHWLFFRGW